MELSSESAEIFEKKSFFSRFSRRQKIAFFITVGIVALALVVTGVVFTLRHDRPTDAVAETPSASEDEPSAPAYYAPLTGRPLTAEMASNALVTAVLIENSPEARPQSGLHDAEIIYEAIANGGVSRFAALYQANAPALLGPVRSLRLQFLDWIAPYNAGIVHCGGSWDSLQEVRNFRDLDEMSNGRYFWRESGRYAPHNLYTSMENLRALSDSKGYATSNFITWSRSDEPHSSSINATQISLNLSTATFNVRYNYDSTTNTYLRSFATGQKHLDREKGQLAPSVVIALRVNSRSINGDQEQITTIGTGDAYVFQNGVVINARWQKLSRTAPLELHDTSGNPIVLARGQTWITAVPNNNTISWD